MQTQAKPKDFKSERKRGEKTSLVLCFSCKKKKRPPSGRTILSDPHVFFSSRLDMFACVFDSLLLSLGDQLEMIRLLRRRWQKKGTLPAESTKQCKRRAVYSPNQMSDCFWFLLHLHWMEQQPSRSRRRIRRRLEIIITWLVFWLFPQHLIFSASVLLQLPSILFCCCDYILRWLCQENRLWKKTGAKADDEFIVFLIRIAFNHCLLKNTIMNRLLR